jgi:hypothetical protein
MFRVSVLILLVFASATCVAQSELIGDEEKAPVNLQTRMYRGIVVDGDTLASVTLPTLLVMETHQFKNNKQRKHYWKLVYNVKKVLPYARLAGKKMRDLNVQMANMAPPEQKKLIRGVEKEIKKEFTKDIENMTYSQGRILLKLIDRETGLTAYQVVKELRGTFSAVFWQSVCLIFDNSLKQEYNPGGDDEEIESIIYLVDQGLL